MNVYLSDQFYNLSAMTDESFCVYYALRKSCRKGQQLYCVHSQQLYFELSGILPSTRYAQELIETGLTELAHMSLIHILEQQGNLWVLDLTPILIDFQKPDRSFTTVFTEDVQAIFKQSKRPFRLMRFYCYLISTLVPNEITEKYIIGTKSKAVMAHQFEVSYQTAARYMNQLETMGILYVYRSQCMIPMNGNYITLPNIYGRLCNADLITRSGLFQDAKQLTSEHKNHKANLFRSAAGKYAAFIKGHPYPVPELETIYIILQEYNRRQKEPERRKDLTVFSAYPFYNTSQQ